MSKDTIAGHAVSQNKLIVGGEEGEALTGDIFEGLSSPHDIVVARYVKGGVEGVDRAVTAARQAFDSGPWPRRVSVDQVRVLHQVGQLIRRDRDRLAGAGKPITQALDEVDGSADLWEYGATLARQSYSDAHNVLGTDALAVLVTEPVGIISIITPRNFPLLIVSQKLPFAIPGSCIAVVKPSQLTTQHRRRPPQAPPRAGADDGVANIITGGGDAMTGHPDTDMVLFTGSTAVGHKVAPSGGEQRKRIGLDLGGNSPQIVYADADLDAAIDAVVFGVYFNAGQRCNSGSRGLVHSSIAKDFQDQIVKRAPLVTRATLPPRSGRLLAVNRFPPSDGTSPNARALGRDRYSAGDGYTQTSGASTSRPCSEAASLVCRSRRRRSSGPCCQCSLSTPCSRPSGLRTR